jgi:hypothetical protein
MLDSITVTGTVTKPIGGVDEKYTKKEYKVNLLYGENLNLEPLADGGYISFIPAETGGSYYEVHTFLESGTLSFRAGTETIPADILLVAGGGASGGDTGDFRWDGPGGGGAGGLLYTSAPVDPAVSTLVYVGKGGASVQGWVHGNNGEGSWIGSSDTTKIAAAPGGGGGGGGGRYDTYGQNGGSGGGAANGPNQITGIGKGEPQYGNDGGRGPDAGGGGGGAGGVGRDAYGSESNGVPGAGGDGWKPSGESAWISTVTGVMEFSHGGRGGGPMPDYNISSNGKYYGDGGSGGGVTGGSGHDGIVIIRFPRSKEPPPYTDAQQTPSP